MTAEKSYFQEHDRYAEDVTTVGAAPERGNRYAYRFGTGPLAIRDVLPTPGDEGFEVDVTLHGGLAEPTAAAFVVTFGSALSPPATPGLSAIGCPNCNIDGIAAGNVDGELTGIDTWYISTADAVVTAPCATSGSPAPAGIPIVIFNDAECD
ncbi:MAG: hypothetical protein M3Q75_02325 [Gemmatimonadota bacterium]|nr:hypothetical protein [Gemmatimonadota bacterium]